MKYTLLKMVQLILSSMSSDEVNDISDTTEAGQVVDIIEQTYNDIMSVVDYPEHWSLFELQASGDPTRPTVMYLPEGVTQLEWIQYDNLLTGETARNMVPVSPLAKYEFLARMNTLDSADDDVYQYNLMVGSETFDIRGKNNAFPGYFTTFDDRTLIFDNYYSDEDTTLVANKTLCYGKKIPVFTRSNTFVPDLDPLNFSLLFNSAKSQCFAEIKQVENATANQRARRAQVATQWNKGNTAVDRRKTPPTPNFGRKK